MKKNILLILTVLSATILVGCQHEDRKMHLKFDAENVSGTSMGNGKELVMVTIDERKNVVDIGEKEFWNKEVKISSDETLAQFLSQQIAEGLKNQGFVVKGNHVIFGGNETKSDKTLTRVTIRVKSFKYESEAGFLMGETKFKGNVIIAVTKPNGEKFERSFEFKNKGRNFVVSSEKRDAKNINNAVQDVIEAILKDSELLARIAS